MGIRTLQSGNGVLSCSKQRDNLSALSLLRRVIIYCNLIAQSDN